MRDGSIILGDPYNQKDLTKIAIESSTNTHWDYLPKFLSLHYFTTLEGGLDVQRSKQAKGTILCLFGQLFFSQNGMTLKKPTKIIKIQ